MIADEECAAKIYLDTYNRLCHKKHLIEQYYYTHKALRISAARWTITAEHDMTMFMAKVNGSSNDVALAAIGLDGDFYIRYFVS